MNKQNIYDTVLFDLDGTLLNTLDGLHASVNHTMAEMGMPLLAKEAVRQRLGNGQRNLIMRSLPEGSGDETVERALQIFKDHYLRTGLAATHPYPGIMEMLSEMRAKGVKMAVVSNKFADATTQMCRHFFDGLISVAVGEHAGVRRKPAPDMVEAAIKELQAEKSRTLYVGDSEVDILTARNSGVKCISVDWGFRDREFLIENGAEQIIEKPSDLLPLV